jgi:hypothetical protein
VVLQHVQCDLRLLGLIKVFSLICEQFVSNLLPLLLPALCMQAGTYSTGGTKADPMPECKACRCGSRQCDMHDAAVVPWKPTQ